MNKLPNPPRYEDVINEKPVHRLIYEKIESDISYIIKYLIFLKLFVFLNLSYAFLLREKAETWINKKINSFYYLCLKIYENAFAISKKAETKRVIYTSFFILIAYFMLSGLNTGATGGSTANGGACAYDAQCINLCDNQTALGLASDNLICFSAAACVGGSNYCGGHDGDCQVEAGASQQCDDRAENVCLTDSYCSSNCAYLTLTAPTAGKAVHNKSYAKNSRLGAINLSWTDNSNGESYFRIFYAVNNGTYSQLTTDTASPYTHGSINDNSLYAYYLDAYYTGGTCDGTNSASRWNITADRTGPAPPGVGLYEESVVLAYNFDENSASTVTDKSAYGNDGTTSGATWSATSGYRKGGMTFDGVNDYISVPDKPVFASKNKTLEAWIKFNSFYGKDLIIGKPGQYWLSYNSTDIGCTANRLGFAMFDGDWICASNNAALNKDTWYHIVGVYNGSHLYLYINGTLAGGPTAQGIPGYFAGNFEIGTYSGSLSTYVLNATLDNIRVYDKALTLSEISLKYNLTKQNISNNKVELSWTDRDQDLQLYMPFEEGSGTITWDWSRVKNDGELKNTPTWTIGKFGNAINLDGINDYINTTPINFANVNYVTIAYWIKTGFSGAVNYAHIHWANSTNGGGIAGGINLSNKAYFTFKDDIWASGNYPRVSSVTNVNDNTWHYIAFVYDTTGAKLYVDGILESSMARGSQLSDIGNELIYIGHLTNQPVGSYHFNGSIDEVRIYNRSLTQREIIDVMQSGLIKKRLYRATSYSGPYTFLGNFSSNNYTDSDATDITDPNEVTSLTSSSHSVSIWSNDTTVDISWIRATDSGTTYYYNISSVDWYGNYNKSLIKNTTSYNSSLDGYDILCDTSSGELATTSKDYEETQTTHTCTFTSGSTNYFHIKSKDNAGNWDDTSADLGPFYIDNSHPSICNVTLINESTKYGYASGKTIYYNSVSSGYFTVRVNATDAVSGISNVTYSAATSAGTIDTASAYRHTYDWDTSDTYSSTSTLTCKDKARNSNATTFIVTRDVTAPNGGSVSYTNGYTSSSSITFSDGSDSGAGVNTSSTRILRRTAVLLSNNSCGTFGSWSQIGSKDPTSPYSDTPTGTNCYEYRYEVYDNVYNNINYTSSNQLIYNNLPTHNNPVITPASPNSTSNLTCTPQSVADSDGNKVINITNWYKNNKSITVLNMPFEGHAGNEEKNTTDYSGYGNNGTVFGATWNRTGGKIGGGYGFDGVNDYIEIIHSGSYKPRNSITIEAWFKADDWDSTFDITRTGNSQMRLFTAIGGGFRHPTIQLTFTSAGIQTAQWTNQLLNANNWYYIAGTYDGDNLTVYFNGTARKVTNIGQDTISHDVANLRIGMNGASYADGYVDELRIYNYSLSPEQIWANYNAGLLGRIPNIITSNELSAGDVWLCSITPNDGYQDGTIKNSTAVTIQNSPPSIPTNITCDGGYCNSTFTGNVELACYGSNDVNLDTITYVIHKGNESQLCSGSANSCSSYGSEATCGYDSGCSWIGGMSLYDNCNQGSLNTTFWTFSGSAGGVTATGTHYFLDHSTTAEMTIYTTGYFNHVTIEAQPVKDLGDGRGHHISIGTGALCQQVFCNSNTGYTVDDGYAWCNANGGSSAILYRLDNCAQTQIDSATWTPDFANDQNFTFITNSSGVFFLVNGVIILNSTDTTYSNGGFITISSGGGTSNRGSWYVDNVWNHSSLECTGTPDSCNTYSMESACTQVGCSWDTIIDYSYVGNHTEGNSYIWDFSSEPEGEIYEYLQCKAIDLTGSNTYSANYTQSVNLSFSQNTLPTISKLSFNPLSAFTDDNIQCNATILDSEETTVTVEYLWYNSGSFVIGGNKTGVNVNQNTVISTLGYGNTTKGQNWNCTIRANDGIGYSDYNSSIIQIKNSPPLTPTHITPTQANITVHDRSPFFRWTSSDADGDDINYTINITFPSMVQCGTKISALAPNSNYTPSYDFCLDLPINWTVRAFDGYNYSSWSQKWNFTIESYISLSLSNSTINFGSLTASQSKNTDNGSVSPLRIENDGNIMVNVARIGANASLWIRQPLNTIYFQFKADNDTTETKSFNWSGSITEWTNITGIAVLNKSVVKHLDYKDANDTAEIDLKVTVPLNEPPTNKRAQIYIVGGLS